MYAKNKAWLLAGSINGSCYCYLLLAISHPSVNVHFYLGIVEFIEYQCYQTQRVCCLGCSVQEHGCVVVWLSFGSCIYLQVQSSSSPWKEA